MDEYHPCDSIDRITRAVAVVVCIFASSVVAPVSARGQAPAAGGSAQAPAASKLIISGDLRVRYEHTTVEPGSLDRDRGVLRARLNAHWAPSAHLEFGVRATTGDPADPRTTDVTLGDFAHKPAVSLDQAYIKVRQGGLTVGGGRLPNPFIGSELVWDGDVNPQGISGEYALPHVGCVAPSVTSMLFAVDERPSAPDSRMVGTQLVGKAQLSDAATLTLGAAYYDYRLKSLRASDVRGNRLTADGAQYLSDFNLVAVLGRLSYRGAGPAWPVTLTAEYVVNTGAAGSNEPGLDVEIDAGRTRVKGAMRARYGFMAADRDAVLAAFSHDNTPLATAYRMHTLAWDWYQRAGASTNVTLYVYRSTMPGAGQYHARLRLNFMVEF